MQEATDAAMAATQRMAEETEEETKNEIVYPCYTAAPKLSLRAGKYGSPQTVRITDPTRDAIIYYTTDGWTPTKASPRYRGPIAINSTTTVQAIAIAPNCLGSLVSTAQYTLTASSRAPAPSTEAILREGTPVPLVFAVDVSSKNAEVGDHIRLTLADDLLDDGFVVARKGSQAEGIVTAVNTTGAGGAPGDIRFKVTSLDANGTTIKLRGHALLEGEAKPPNAAALIPVAGVFAVFKHGKDAEIKKGTPFIAYLAADPPISPGK